jgi:transcriptional regulator with XRE-family HTH domain
MTTGEKLAALRKKKGITQEHLAELLQVSRQSVSRWEMDVAFPETEKLIKLARLLECSIDFLLNENLEEDAGTGGRPRKFLRRAQPASSGNAGTSSWPPLRRAGPGCGPWE